MIKNYYLCVILSYMDNPHQNFRLTGHFQNSSVGRLYNPIKRTKLECSIFIFKEVDETTNINRPSKA